MISLEALKVKHFQFLHGIYAAASHEPRQPVPLFEVAEQLGMSQVEAACMAVELQNAGLVEVAVKLGWALITPQGVSEVEQALARPGEPTLYFPALAQHVDVRSLRAFSDPDGEFGTIPAGAVEFLPLKNCLGDLLPDLRHHVLALHLQPEERELALAALDTIETEMARPRVGSYTIIEALGLLRQVLDTAVEEGEPS